MSKAKVTHKTKLIQAWKEYLEFWAKYPAKLQEESWTLDWPLQLEGFSTAELLECDPDSQPNLALDEKYERVCKYLELVVHPDDLEYFKKLFPRDPKREEGVSDEESKENLKILFDLACHLFSLYCHGSSFPPCQSSPLVPVTPQPFYGSPVDASVFSVLNNPASDARAHFSATCCAFKQFVELHQVNIQRLQIDADRLSDSKSHTATASWHASEDSWITEGEYYFNFYGIGTQKKEKKNDKVYPAADLVKKAREDKGEFLPISSVIFHADLCPYQSPNTEATFMETLTQQIKDSQGTSVENILPSTRELLKLLGAWVKAKEEEQKTAKEEKKTDKPLLFFRSPRGRATKANAIVTAIQSRLASELDDDSIDFLNNLLHFPSGPCKLLTQKGLLKYSESTKRN